MTPLRALTPIAAAAFAIAGCQVCEAPGPAPVILISLDTTRVDHLSSHGYDKPTTPHLSAIAQDGVVIPNFVTTSSWTLPSHASLFTGLYPSTHGAHYAEQGNALLSDAVGGQGLEALFRVNRLPEEAVTLAEVLREAGYQTFGAGAGPWLKPMFGLAQGFDHWDTRSSTVTGATAPEINESALRFLEMTREQPFLLFLNYFDPHDPYSDPDGGAKRFMSSGDKREVAETLANYDAEIAYMDRHIGELMSELRRRGLYDRSWIIVVSDHGEHFGEHGLVTHGFSLYEDVIAGVLIVKPPDGSCLPADSDHRVQSVDIMPTLLQALGVVDAPPMEGQAIGSISHPAVAELYRSEANVRWKGIRFNRHLTAIYSGPYKLVMSTRADDPDAGLFDLASDPGEEVDLLRKRPKIHSSLRDAYESWRGTRLPPLAVSPVEAVDDETREQLEALGYLPEEASEPSRD
jgi:arylsulfatase A-like enzyme